MPSHKKQHFVPRFYLKNFSIQLNEKSIGIFNIGSEKFIDQASLKNQSYKRYFYGEDGTVESALGLLEASASRVIAGIIGNRRLPARLSDDHFSLLSFTILLHARTEYTADQHDEMFDKFEKVIFSKGDPMKNSFNGIAARQRNTPQMCLGSATMSLPVAFDLKYSIFYNKTDIPFITSDNPVVLYNQFLEKRRQKYPGGSTGLAVKGLQIFLPLSPRHCLLFFDQDVYWVGRKSETIVTVLGNADVGSLNYLQCANAYNNLYFNEEVSADYIARISSRVKMYRKKAKAFVSEYPEYPQEAQPNGTTRSLIHLYRRDTKIGFALSLISLTKKAKNYRLGDKVLHVRNEEVYELSAAFMDAVVDGGYTPDEFGRFLAEWRFSRVPE